MILQVKQIKHLRLKGRFLILICLSFFACSSNKEKTQDLATTGEIEVHTDEAFFPILQSQQYIFESLYKNAKVNIVTASETEAINAFVNGTSEMIVTGRRLSQQEIDYIGKKKYSVYQTKIALDAVVLIVNKKFPDSSLGTGQLRKILKGSLKNWHDIDTKLPKEKIVIVFDKSNSSNLLHLNATLGVNSDSINFVTAGSMPQVIDYVSNNIYSIGVVSWSWISDEEDPKVVQYLQQVKPLALGEGEKFFLPSATEVMDSLYPLVRGIFAINKGARAGLGSGFSSFMASDRGQRIILKTGIVPATIPGREIELK